MFNESISTDGTVGTALNPYDTSTIVANPYTCTTNYIYTTPPKYTIDAAIFKDIPTIFTIDSTKVINPKYINIKYKELDPILNPITGCGNIYINSGIFGIYDESNNFYWKNEVLVEVESEKDIEKIQPGMKFTNATQWEKKLSVEEIINMVNDPLVYYVYVHNKVEQYIAKESRTTRIEKHREIDRLYGLE